MERRKNPDNTMRFKERPDIPAPVVRALRSDAYRESIESHLKDLPKEIKQKFTHTMSVTTLDRSPRQLQLSLRHSHEIIIDPEEMRHSLFGRITHTLLEENKGPGEVVEERLGIAYPLMLSSGKRVVYWIHGQADLYSYQEGVLWDYKTPRTGSLKYNKRSHHAQLNILGYIWRKNGRKVTRLRNVYLLIKDWNPQFVKDEPGHEYPKSWIVPQDVPMWSDEDCMKYLTERLTRHYLNESKPDDDLDPCDDDELWRSEPRYKVFKLDEDGHPQKTAKYNGASKEVAQQTLEALRQSSREKVLAENAKKKKPKDAGALKFDSYVLHELPSSPRRCAFCDARNHCSQRIQQLIAEMESNQSTEHEEEDL
jgi:hypothetical protein